MGLLRYADGSARMSVSDRALAHLQMVITAKLRRDEAFLFTWRLDVANGGGRIGIWLDPGIPLRFEFRGDAAVEANEVWLDLLSKSADSAGGLLLLDEPGTNPDTWSGVEVAIGPEPKDDESAA